MDSEQTMKDKSLEYDGPTDVHRQFWDAAAELNISPMKVAAVHLNKHISAINSMVSGHSGTQPFHSRIVDALNFLRILDEMWTLHSMDGSLPPKVGSRTELKCKSCAAVLLLDAVSGHSSKTGHTLFEMWNS